MEVDIGKYTIMRKALAEQKDDPQDIEMIHIKPKTFPLKKQHSRDVLDAAKEILDDPKIMKGMSPLDTLQSLAAQNMIDNGERPGPEVILYVMVCYAVALQQGWIIYSTLINKFILNPDNKIAVEYAQDVHKQGFKLDLH